MNQLSPTSLLTDQIKEAINIQINKIKENCDWSNFRLEIPFGDTKSIEKKFKDTLKETAVLENLAKLSVHLWTDYDYQRQFLLKVEHLGQQYDEMLETIGFVRDGGFWMSKSRPHQEDVLMNVFLYCLSRSNGCQMRLADDSGLNEEMNRPRDIDKGEDVAGRVTDENTADLWIKCDYCDNLNGGDKERCGICLSFLNHEDRRNHRPVDTEEADVDDSASNNGDERPKKIEGDEGDVPNETILKGNESNATSIKPLRVGWTCLKCTLINNVKAVRCEACLTFRDNERGNATPHKSQSKKNRAKEEPKNIGSGFNRNTLDKGGATRADGKFPRREAPTGGGYFDPSWFGPPTESHKRGGENRIDPSKFFNLYKGETRDDRGKIGQMNNGGGVRDDRGRIGQMNNGGGVRDDRGRIGQMNNGGGGSHSSGNHRGDNRSAAGDSAHRAEGRDIWSCSSCTLNNRIGSLCCEACFTFLETGVEEEYQEERPRVAETSQELWKCIHCNTDNLFDTYLCVSCRNYAPFFDKWICERCVFFNKELAKRCSVCRYNNNNLRQCQKCEGGLFNVNSDVGHCRECGDKERRTAGDRGGNSGAVAGVRPRQCWRCRKAVGAVENSTCRECSARQYYCCNASCGAINDRAAKYCKRCRLRRGANITEYNVADVSNGHSYVKMWKCTFCPTFNTKGKCCKCHNLRHSCNYRKCACNWVNLAVSKACEKCFKVL